MLIHYRQAQALGGFGSGAFGFGMADVKLNEVSWIRTQRMTFKDMSNDFQLSFKKLTKKDLVTRCKGLSEIEVLQQRLPYPRSTGVDPQDGAQRCRREGSNH